ncbi:proline dehydrogenase family protein [Sporichthya sp.]|uniref:proline dehydrogenase family protein n=1 Tax=Sporichthya sp. TaxID=65475 RepID=UPI0018401C9A|nr:proline dehydrogenase family protein [Sporichthya sp.]MBA3745498.1 proline dehydrogenase family protein [Sporichthya sp.]
MLRHGLLAASRSTRVRDLITRAPGTREVVRRFVAGRSLEAALVVARDLVSSGLRVSLDHLGEDTADRAQADHMREVCIAALGALNVAGLTGGAEISLKLSSLGQALGPDGHRIAHENAAKVCAAAAAHGTTVTLDMEDHTTTDATLSVLRELRVDFPWVGAVLQAYLHRTEADCRDLASAGSRVRLCKGAYREPASVAYQDPHDVNLSYVRALKVLMAGQGYPMVASHDPRMLAIAADLAARAGRNPGDFEYQMLYGVRPDEQRRLAGAGETVRVYVPFGEEWYGYLMRRLAERPANVVFFARALLSKG